LDKKIGLDKKKFLEIATIVFDMDGVITSEAEYWNTADHTVLELFYGKQFIGLEDEMFLSVMIKPGASITLNHFVSQNFIALLRNNGLNTNWDLAYFSAALYLVELIAAAKPRDRARALLDAPFKAGTLRELGKLVAERRRMLEPVDHLSAYFINFRKKRLLARPLPAGPAETEPRAERFIEDINAWRFERTGLDVPVFSQSGPFWDLCHTLFQERYLGDNLYLKDHDSRVSEIPKDGMIQYEMPVIPARKIISTLAMLKEAGLKFGIATGRPYDEIMIPLKRWGLFHFFEPEKISTHREIAEAERYLKERGEPASVAKPHPYVYLRSIYPEKSVSELLEVKLPLPGEESKKILIVGDTLSDLIAARKIGARAAVVLTGVKSLEAVARMRALDPDFILDNVSQFEQLF
jgi:phosphoglycolate phosphatase-like HAD superfamily hydrolase